MLRNGQEKQELKQHVQSCRTIQCHFTAYKSDQKRLRNGDWIMAETSTLNTPIDSSIPTSLGWDHN
jgi:hypothetical protein